MNGMTTQERYNEISSISGMTEEVVRRVLNAEKISILNSLKRGERATLIGRCVIRPEIRNKIVVGGNSEKYIKLSADVALGLENSLAELKEFEESHLEEEVEGIRVNQIQALI